MMNAEQDLSELECILPGRSELAKLMRSLDWSQADLPTPQEWPEELRVAVRLCLTSRIPIVIYWGPTFTTLYNDAYISFLGSTKHPYFLGKPCKDCWLEIWETIEPMLHSVYESGEATWSKDIKMFFARKLPLEEVYIRFSFGPILAADGKTVKGIFCPCTETTEQVIAARRIETLRKLSIRSSDTENVSIVCERSVKSIAENPEDIPFAAIYLVDEANNEIVATLNAKVRLPEPSIIAHSIVLSKDRSVMDMTPFDCFFSTVFNSQQPGVLSNLPAFGIHVTSDTWAGPVKQAIVLPILSTTKEANPSGILMLGISPNRVLDDLYRSFLDLVVRDIGAAINNAKVYEVECKRAEALTELNRAKTRFFTNISHEFRTPLTLMLGPIENAFDHSTPALKGEDLSIVHRNALRLLKLVNTLLNFSRIEAGRIQANFEPINISEFTTELTKNFRSAFERAGLKFSVQCDTISEPAYIDSEMWEKIVLNLLSNAFKFTFEGEINVRLQLINDCKAIQFSVQDTGTGIASSEISSIFERFHRIEGAKGRTHEGSGIGLALIQDLIKIHCGEVKVKSELGKGSTFTVILPMGYQHLPQEQVSLKRKFDGIFLSKAESYPLEAVRWLPKVSSEIETPSSLGCRILIADDNADMREYLYRLLSRHWSVQTVCSGEAALETLKNIFSSRGHTSFDLLITDIMMPGLDGFQLIEAVKKDPQLNKLPVIMISARAGEDSRVEGLQAGADDYLVKPFSARELIARVNIQLELSKQRKALLSELNTMTLLQNIATRFVQENDMSAILLEIVDAAISITNADKGNMQLVDEEKGVLKFAAHRGFHQPFLDHFANCSGKAACGKALEKGERIIVEDVAKSPIFLGTENLAHLLAEGVQAVQSTPLRNRSGKIVGVLSTHYFKPSLPDERDLQMMDLLARFSADLIERGQWQQERTQWMEKLREIDRRKNDFLAILSHELRNPLATISNSIFMLSYVNSKNDITQGVQRTIERQVQQITRLVDDLLDVSRINQNKIQLQFEQINLNTIVHHTIEDNRSIFNNLGITLREKLAEEPVMIEADPARISQIVSNLLQNSAKFSLPAGMTQVSVSVENNHAIIRVHDNGMGIETELLEQLFEPFIQADTTLARSDGGLGLGLSLVKGLVELHGGIVEVLSKGKGHGAEFIIKIPLAKDIHNKEIKPSITKAKHITRKKILIIEDNMAAAESLSQVIEIFGHEVFIANHSQDGIEKARKIKPHFVLCDIGLPFMDGYEVAKIFKADANLASIFLIALSGYARKEDIEKAYSAGFNQHLAKPPNITMLEEILRMDQPFELSKA